MCCARNTEDWGVFHLHSHFIQVIVENMNITEVCGAFFFFFFLHIKMLTILDFSITVKMYASMYSNF